MKTIEEIERIQDADERFDAIEDLIGLGSGAIKTALHGLNHQDDEVKRIAMYVILRVSSGRPDNNILVSMIVDCFYLDIRDTIANYETLLNDLRLGDESGEE